MFLLCEYKAKIWWLVFWWFVIILRKLQIVNMLSMVKTWEYQCELPQNQAKLELSSPATETHQPPRPNTICEVQYYENKAIIIYLVFQVPRMSSIWIFLRVTKDWEWNKLIPQDSFLKKIRHLLMQDSWAGNSIASAWHADKCSKWVQLIFSLFHNDKFPNSNFTILTDMQNLVEPIDI